MSLFIPAPTECSPPGASAPAQLPGTPGRSWVLVANLMPRGSLSTLTHTSPSPCTHSFSSTRSPKKEPFCSTVILLLLSSLWG